jgi:hypothetical protein
MWKEFPDDEAGAGGENGVAALRSHFLLLQGYFFSLQNHFLPVQGDFCRFGKGFSSCRG